MTPEKPNANYIGKALNGKREGSSWRCPCVVCSTNGDDARHLIVTEKAGKVLLKCMGGAKQDELIAALTERGLWGQRNGHEPRTPQPAKAEKAELQREYPYREEDGELKAFKGRFIQGGKKTFMWRVPDEERWTGLQGMDGLDLPLFGAELVSGSHEVWWCEGEKATEAARDHGFTAVCGYTGASKVPTKALKVLEGKAVVIWPDNDAPGIAFAGALRSALDGLAESVRIVRPDVPESGDAYDYFSAGGTVDALRELLSRQRTEAWVEGVRDGWLVSVPDGGGLIRLHFAEVTYAARRAVEAKVKVWQEIPGISRRSFSSRLNLHSLGNRDQFRRQLDSTIEREGKGFWATVLNQAVEMVLAAIANHDPSVRLSDAPDRTDEGYLLFPFVAGAGPTILYGDGGSGKSYMALEIARSVCGMDTMFGMLDEPVNVLYVDYETDAATVKRRALRLGGIPDGLFYWAGRGVPFAEMVPGLSAKIERDGIGFIIVDSAVPACGGKPEESDCARAYFAALAELGLRSLTVSHVTKDANADKYPFGSIFWNNLARLTWNVKVAHEEDGSVTHLGLFNRKVNDGRLQKPIGVGLQFGDMVTLSREELAEDFSKSLSLGSRIRKELLRGKMTVKELAEELDASEPVVRTRCNKMKDAARSSERSGDGSFYWEIKARK